MLTKSCVLVPKSYQGPEVVEVQTTLLSYLSNNIQCLPERLGSSIPRGDNRGALDNEGSSESYQFLGIEGSLLSPSVFPEGEAISECADQNGQSNSHLLHELNGKSVFVPTVPAYIGNMELVSCSPDHYPCRVFTRQ